MRKVPGFEQKEFWDYADSCEDCRNHEASVQSCINVCCPYLTRKFLTESVTTYELFWTFLRGIKYSPFNLRLDAAMGTFEGNRTFLDNNHLKRFNGMIKKSTRYTNSKLSILYVFAMYPHIQNITVKSAGGTYLPIGKSHDSKTEMLIDFINELASNRRTVSLKGISTCKEISVREFICLCNAVLIKRFGLSVVKIGE